MKKIDNGKARKDKDVQKANKKIVKLNNIKIPDTIMDLDGIRQSLSLLFS